jgi:hypothetical protein
MKTKKIHKKILKTYDYSLFRKLKGNRDILEPHLKAITKSIEEDGYSYCAIQVNEKYEVVEGQHHLEACKSLNLPVYYYIVEGANIDDVTVMNTHRKNWGFDQWLNRYVKYNYQEYKIYQHFYDQWGFDHWSTIFLLCRTKGVRGRGTLKKTFEIGELKIETLEEGKKWSKRIMDIEQFYSNYKRRAFIQAMIRVFHDSAYNHKTFLKKLSLVRDRLYDCSTVGLYLQRIDDIMNYSTPKNQRVNFYYQWSDSDSIFHVGAA